MSSEEAQRSRARRREGGKYWSPPPWPRYTKAEREESAAASSEALGASPALPCIECRAAVSRVECRQPTRAGGLAAWAHGDALLQAPAGGGREAVSTCTRQWHALH